MLHLCGTLLCGAYIEIRYTCTGQETYEWLRPCDYINRNTQFCNHFNIGISNGIAFRHHLCSIESTVYSLYQVPSDNATVAEESTTSVSTIEWNLPFLHNAVDLQESILESLFDFACRSSAIFSDLLNSRALLAQKEPPWRALVPHQHCLCGPHGPRWESTG